MNKIRVGIYGITGYTGEELIKILSKHRFVSISMLSSRSTDRPKALSEIYPHLAQLQAIFEPFNIKDMAERTDVVFLALPHKIAFEIVPDLIRAGKRVIDLSADFRLKDFKQYEIWYGEKHTAKDLLDMAVYGLPELYRDKIKTATLIANPGCYPTSIILGCAPALKTDSVDPYSIIIDAKSGISGAGRKSVKEYFQNEHPNLRPYSIAGNHRHIPEIEQELSNIAGKQLTITFTPQIIPMERGMMSMIYMNLRVRLSTRDFIDMYKQFYSNEPFIRVLDDGVLPEVRNVVGTNFCDIGIKVDERAGRVIIISTIDNLGKGASGQAVQNMNIMYGFNEKTGFFDNDTI